jgi:predicted nucleotidyltransferase
MLSTTIAIDTAKYFLKDLEKLGYSPSKAILFGSMAKGTMHEYSDIDLAVWDEKFLGSITFDSQPIIKLLVKYKDIELHPFNIKTTPKENPFVSIIEKEGIAIFPNQKS